MIHAGIGEQTIANRGEGLPFCDLGCSDGRAVVADSRRRFERLILSQLSYRRKKNIRRNLMSIYVIDEMMGRGKTSAMINYINQSGDDVRYLFIVPL